MRPLEFPIRKFLKESKKWDDKIKKLKEELESMSELPSVDNQTGVRSGNISDLTGQTALRELKIQAEIEELLLNKEILRHGINTLTEDERALYDGFYNPKKRIGVFVEEYGKAHGMCDRTVRYEKDRMLEKLRITIEKDFYGED